MANFFLKGLPPSFTFLLLILITVSRVGTRDTALKSALFKAMHRPIHQREHQFLSGLPGFLDLLTCWTCSPAAPWSPITPLFSMFLHCLLWVLIFCYSQCYHSLG